jgi:hypothetical protein
LSALREAGHWDHGGVNMTVIDRIKADLKDQGTVGAADD